MSILQKNKKVAAGIGVAAVAAAAIALGAGTYAAFSDTETAPNVTFAAGTLDLTIGASATTDATSLTNLKPGSRTTVTYTVDNVGSVDGTLSVKVALSGDENGCAEPETESTVDPSCNAASELASALTVEFGGVNYGPLSQFANTPFEVGPLAAAPGPSQVTFVLVVPSTAGNEIMTDTATIVGTAILSQ